MKNKDKKLMLNLFVLIAIALTIASIFTPSLSSNSLDYYEKGGFTYNDVGFKWVVDSSIIFSRWTVSIGNITAAKYFIFGFFPYETELWKEVNLEGLQIMSYDLISEDVAPSSNILITGILLIIFTLLISFFYFYYRGIKNCSRKKTRYFLYDGIIVLFIAIISFFVFNFSLNLIESNKTWLELTDYIKFEYGFYYMIISSVLFFSAFVLQNFFIDYSEDKATVEKVLFEKYKK